MSGVSDAVDHVPGVSAEELAEAIRQAEEGYAVEDVAWEANPHYRPMLSEDLTTRLRVLSAREEVAPEEIIQQALAAYLDAWAA